MQTTDANEPYIKDIYVFLPQGYDSSQQRYPVLYYLHGHGSDSNELLSFEDVLFQALEQGKVAPFILVAVNGDNSLGGSFYVNSKHTGRWEDNITGELIPLIGQRYRTLAAAQSRGVMGFSMGDFGALHLGLAHPDLFAALRALCPVVFVPDKGLADALIVWRSLGGSFLESYAAAFSPGLNIPLLDG